MEQELDFYTVLNLSRLATDKEIRKAYLELARVFHPDRAPGRNAQELETIFHLIQEAYSVLSDPLLRPIYDKYGRLGLRGLERFTFMKIYVEKFYAEENEERKKDILKQILSYLNEAMAQELTHEREKFYTSYSSVHFAVNMKDFCNHAHKYVNHSCLRKAMRLISIMQAGVESKVTFVALQNWKLSMKASNVEENQHSIGAGQLGLRAAYQASNNVKYYSGMTFHSLSSPSLRLGTKLYYGNYFLKPEVSYSQGDLDYKVNIGGKLFNQFDFKQSYGSGSTNSEVQVNLGSKGIFKTEVAKDFVHNTISVTPTWQVNLTDDILHQLNVSFSSNGRLMLASVLNYAFTAGKRIGVQTSVTFKKNELRNISFVLILNLESFTIRFPITLGDEAELSSLLISGAIGLVGHFFAYCFHSIGNRLIHNEKNYVRFMKFSSQYEVFKHYESELNVQEARGRVSIFRAYFGDNLGVRNLHRKKERNFETPKQCDQYLRCPAYEVTQYLRSKVSGIEGLQIRDARRWTLTNEILKDMMLFDPTWREDKKKCSFYIVVKRREEVEDVYWNPEKQPLLLIV